MTSPSGDRAVAILCHYFPPLNSSGAKRMEALSAYFAEWGEEVVVISTTKSGTVADLSETPPPGVTLLEVDPLGRLRPSRASSAVSASSPASAVGQTTGQKLKAFVMRLLGQLPDPRLSFALAMASPFLAAEVKEVLRRSRVAIGTAPPWPVLLAAVIAKRRFRVPVVLDYRDNFSNCHEMPGGKFAKRLELTVDRFLARRADLVVTISDPMTDYYGRMSSGTVTVMNGFDARRMTAARAAAPYVADREGPAIVRYLGVVTPGRIPHALLAALEELVAEGVASSRDVQFEFYGDALVLQEHLAGRPNDLRDMFRFLAPVPYDVALQKIVTADWLLFVEHAVPPRPGEEASAAGILPTKMFEYASSGRPILADVAANTLMGGFIRAAGDMHVVGNDPASFRRALTSPMFARPPECAVSEAVQAASREHQSRKYLDVISRFR
ncbi:MAG: hypothetical protein K2X07_03935 [Caulobacteraceae bacterium]|nr:hypothetical protein [Caulobacteraceae bacterium]